MLLEIVHSESEIPWRGLTQFCGPLPPSGGQPLNTPAYQYSRAVQRAVPVRALPGGRVNTAPVIGMVFPGI